jgi:hypothetical protein
MIDPVNTIVFGIGLDLFFATLATNTRDNHGGIARRI